MEPIKEAHRQRVYPEPPVVTLPSAPLALAPSLSPSELRDCRSTLRKFLDAGPALAIGARFPPADNDHDTRGTLFTVTPARRNSEKRARDERRDQSEKCISDVVSDNGMSEDF